MEDIDLTKITAFPFQTQIEYTALDGSKMIRVVTQTQSVSNDREKLQRRASFSVLASNAMHQQTACGRARHHRFA